MIGITKNELKHLVRYYLIFFTLLLFLPLLNNMYYIHIAIIAFIYIVLATSLDVLVGYTGALSLGHAGFFAVGAYTSTLLSMKYGVSPWIGLFIAGFTAMIFGLIIGIPALKLRGPYLAISTLGYGVIIYMVLNNLDVVTRGPLGIPGIPTFPGIGPINFSNRVVYYYFALAMAVSLTFLLHILLKSRYGMILVAIREDETAARAIGINVDLFRISSFMVSALFAGIAGSLYAHYMGYISPDLSSLDTSIEILSMTLVGGFGTLVGPIFGAMLLVIISEALMPLLEIRLLLYGVLIITIVRFFPSGLMGIYKNYIYTHLRDITINVYRRGKYE